MSPKDLPLLVYSGVEGKEIAALLQRTAQTRRASKCPRIYLISGSLESYSVLECAHVGLLFVGDLIQF